MKNHPVLVVCFVLAVAAGSIRLYTFYADEHHEVTVNKNDLPLYIGKLPILASVLGIRVSESIKVPVLMYHYVRIVDKQQDQLGYNLSVTPSEFDEQLKYLSANSYNAITPNDLYEAVEHKTKLPANPIILTFDDGYQDFYTTAFPLLQKYQFRATNFVVPGFVSDKDGRYLTWEQIKELDQSELVTIGAHTMHHLSLPSSKNAEQEISSSKTTLESFLGHQVDTFAYPYGAFTIKVADMVKNAGFKLAFTTEYGIEHLQNSEMLMSRVRVSGGESLNMFASRLSGQARIFHHQGESNLEKSVHKR